MLENRNLFFLLYTLITIAAVMSQIKNALNSIILFGSLEGVELTIFEMKIYATNNTYTIGYYFLIPIILGILYNLFIEIKKKKK